MNYILAQIFCILLKLGLVLFFCRIVWSLIPKFIRKGLVGSTRITYKLVKPVVTKSYEVCKDIYNDNKKPKEEGKVIDIEEKKRAVQKKLKNSNLRVIK